VLVGGGARSEAVRRIAPALFGLPVLVPPPGEYVADGPPARPRGSPWVVTAAADVDRPKTPEVYEDSSVPADPGAVRRPPATQ
jgi:xylulokinase